LIILERYAAAYHLRIDLQNLLNKLIKRCAIAKALKALQLKTLKSIVPRLEYFLDLTLATVPLPVSRVVVPLGAY